MIKEKGDTAVSSDAMAAECPIALAKGERKKVRAQILCPEVKEWNPDTPVLYAVTAMLGNEKGEVEDDHYNHPGIYIWGILNECASHTEYGKSCYEAQLSLIRSLDRTRPRSFASCQFKKDICLGLADVVSFNMYPLWYHDTPVEYFLSDLYDWVQESTEGAGKPFLVTEVGAGAIYGYRTPEKVKWSEEYQTEAVEKQLNAILSHEGTSGVYIWQFCDCRVCDSWFGSRPRTMNNKGIVDEYRRPKLAYEVVKRIYSE